MILSEKYRVTNVRKKKKKNDFQTLANGFLLIKR